MSIRRWVVRDYDTRDGEVISERRYFTRWGAEGLLRWHRRLCWQNPRFELRIERVR